MYTKIEIDFDVFKKLTVLRDSPGITENDVIRKLLELPPANPTGSKSDPTAFGKAWASKGALLPDGANLKAEYKGRQYFAVIRDRAIHYDGKNYTTPSGAAAAVTNTQINGWRFWQYRLTERDEWKSLYGLRKK